MTGKVPGLVRTLLLEKWLGLQSVHAPFLGGGGGGGGKAFWRLLKSLRPDEENMIKEMFSRFFEGGRGE